MRIQQNALFLETLLATQPGLRPLAQRRKPVFNRAYKIASVTDRIVIVGPQTLVQRACMGVSNSGEPIAFLATGALLLFGLALGSCASSNSLLMDARAEASEPTYLLLQDDLWPKRENREMTADELAKLKKELIDVRDRQAATVKARDNKEGS
jgi:hypothetical protein